jgi:hypothetical protein
MQVNFPEFVEIMRVAEKENEISREESLLIRNQVSTLMRPKCPPKLALALALGVNAKLKRSVVQIK